MQRGAGSVPWVNPFEDSRPEVPSHPPPKPVAPKQPVKKKSYVPSRPILTKTAPLAPKAAGIKKTTEKKQKNGPGLRSGLKETVKAKLVETAIVQKPQESDLSSGNTSSVSSGLSSPPASLAGSPPPEQVSAPVKKASPTVKKASSTVKKTSAPVKKAPATTKEAMAPEKKTARPVKKAAIRAAKQAPPPPPKPVMKDPATVERYQFKVQYQSFTIGTLRTFCTDRGLETTGGKLILIGRLWADDREYEFYAARDYAQNSVEYLLSQAKRRGVTATPTTVIADLQKADNEQDEDKRVDEWKTFSHMSMAELQEEAENYEMPMYLREKADHEEMCIWVGAYDYYSRLEEAERKPLVREKFGGLMTYKVKNRQVGLLAEDWLKYCVLRRNGFHEGTVEELKGMAKEMGVVLDGKEDRFGVVWKMLKGAGGGEKKAVVSGKKRGREDEDEESCGPVEKKARV